MIIAASRLVLSEGGNPVGFPGFTSVGGECLLEAERGGSDIGKDEAHEDGSAAKSFLVVELAASVFEVADHGATEVAILGVGPEDAPLLSLGIVEAKADALKMERRVGDVEFAEISATVPEFADS